ncbi:hypothetical protein Sinac_1480 [Singulisphaera acidiphila DSM 18658]|uniref:Uncharacterized protein n=1 Tax=Singulisphaera acidiphila (strain ATCC BAA-1392 / DSM 18658 / VKM B-2454 / MOB10) TaxID=886293 RepID=L0DAI6_SINAD|nr:hypothetical protein Sinac_1480 [Singulisphaera acidiphila DSM 18658]
MKTTARTSSCRTRGSVIVQAAVSRSGGARQVFQRKVVIDVEGPAESVKSEPTGRSRPNGVRIQP